MKQTTQVHCDMTGCVDVPDHVDILSNCYLSYIIVRAAHLLYHSWFILSGEISRPADRFLSTGVGILLTDS